MHEVHEPLPPALAEVLAAASSLEDARASLRALPEAVAVDTLRLQLGDLYIEVGLTLHLRRLREALAAVRPLGLTIAPTVVAYREFPEQEAMLISRYPSVPGEQLVRVDVSSGPFRNAAKRKFQAEVELLLSRGFAHGYASRGTNCWLYALESGALLLDNWEALRHERGTASSEMKRISFLLTELPLRRRVESAALELVGRDMAGTSEAGHALQTLERAGYPLEAELWAAQRDGARQVVVSDGPWEGQTAHLTREAPPGDAKPGELWFDIQELCAMLRIRTGWLALRPVEPWQLSRRPDAPALVESVVRPQGRPMTHVSWHEAASIAGLYGKSLPAIADWWTAREELELSLYLELWRDAPREWTSTPSPAEEGAMVVAGGPVVARTLQQYAAAEVGLPLEKRHTTGRQDERDRKVGVRTFIRAAFEA